MLADGEFSKSCVYFWLGMDRALQHVRAEGYHGCDFLTRYTMCFRINNSLYDESVEDIKTFLTHLSQLSPMQFVLSFQGEEVRAIHNKQGFEWFWSEPRDEHWRPPVQAPANEPMTQGRSVIARVWHFISGRRR